MLSTCLSWLGMLERKAVLRAECVLKIHFEVFVNIFEYVQQYFKRTKHSGNDFFTVDNRDTVLLCTCALHNISILVVFTFLRTLKR